MEISCEGQPATHARPTGQHSRIQASSRAARASVNVNESDASVNVNESDETPLARAPGPVRGAADADAVEVI